MSKNIEKYIGDTYSGKGDFIVDGKTVAKVLFEVNVDYKSPISKVIMADGKISYIEIINENFKEPKHPLENAVKPIEFEISGILNLTDRKIETKFTGWIDNYPHFMVHQADDIFREL